LMLSVGLWLDAGAEKPAIVDAYVERLVAAGAAGLGFGVGVQHPAVPEALVVAAAERGLPLIAVPERTAFIAVSRHVWEMLAADQYAEIARTSQAQQELTRAAVTSGAAGLVRRVAARIDGWALLLDAAGTVEHAAPAGAERRGAWLATELERFRDITTPVGATLSVDGDQIVVQSLRIGRRGGGFLAVGSSRRLDQAQRSVLNTAVSLLTLLFAQSNALHIAHGHLRTTIFDLIVGGEVERASKLAEDLWGGLPPPPLRLLLVAGDRPCRDNIADVVTAAAAATGEQVFLAEVDGRLAIVHTTGSTLRGRVLDTAQAAGGMRIGESADAVLADLGRAHREADQALHVGERTERQFTAFPDIGASGLLSLLS
ncbi:MAG: PucR family transcriptional regulator ligand-binding domain-containing protein, partial [Actinomycetes bacterium]